MTITDISSVGPIETYKVDAQTPLKSAIENLSQNVQLTQWMAAPATYEYAINEIRQKSHQVLIQYLPDTLLCQLQQFNERSIPQMLIVTGLPFDGLQETELAECFLLGLSSIMNMKPFTYKNEYNGRLLHHVKPDVKHEYSKMGVNSKANLDLHVENAFDPCRPDCMALYCLTGDQAAKTTLYSVTKLLSKMDKSLSDQMESIGKKNEFLFQHPQSFSAGKADVGALIFELPKGETAIRFSTPLSGRSEEAERLKEQLQRFFNTEEGRPDGYCLQRGDLLIWSNHTNLHGRTAYAPNYEPSAQRLLVRMFMAIDHTLPLLRD
ncbi:unnamed protein product [Didymodactylos carnosus]|uniref:TauD/TfdA-like domain-containing protein n=1 Tax=Didymodactylos carnosus TaxID=1234261 RepID=A0A816CGZ2_9BILA|nr:unnamed protein product [Didymodactylos carnosus]CAF1623288.1 unnamed protein product [Didymodactylos carnosus]CAF4298744.1 unnamed protein product [Didymodactylos carnosus]CAF4515133.1 unnamed protein product [Didymodactylos carnosus]